MYPVDANHIYKFIISCLSNKTSKFYLEAIYKYINESSYKGDNQLVKRYKFGQKIKKQQSFQNNLLIGALNSRVNINHINRTLSSEYFRSKFSCGVPLA